MASGGLAYDHYLNRFRQAIEECCDYTRAQALKFGTQSLRSGGCIHLFNMGVSALLRMDLGNWMTPSVEHGYLRVSCAKQVTFMRGVGL